MDTHPLVVEIVKDFVRELSQDPALESLMLVGHGPVEEVETIMWVRQLEKIGQEKQKTMPFREVVRLTLRSDSANLIREHAHDKARRAAPRLAAQGGVVVICGVGKKAVV